MKKMKLMAALLLAGTMSAALLAGCGSEVSTEAAEDTTTQTEAASDASENSSYFHLTYKGKEYEYNSRITSILIAGVDSTDDLTTYNRYSIAPRADTIELLVLDDYNKTVSVLALSRDLMTEIKRYTMNGNYRDTYVSHLGYAYTFGDGGQDAAANLMDSVSMLLNNVPIHEYVVTNTTGVVDVNNLVDGVTVTVPNNALVEIYPEMTEGAVVTLDDDNVETFVRYRDTDKEFSNVGRMERQKAFTTSFISEFKDAVANDKSGTWDKIQDMGDRMHTSITEDQYLELADRLQSEEFGDAAYYTLKGENKMGSKYEEFYADEENRMETIVQLFYIEEGSVK